MSINRGPLPWYQKFWYQGSGPLLILIAGGGGNGDIWNGVLPILAKEYTAVTFDRRGNQRSALPKEELAPMNIPQQARDVIAIIKSLKREKAYIHGNSGGGVIALQMASSYPNWVEGVVPHESPTCALLPDAPKILDFNNYVYKTFKTQGSTAAWKAFSETMVGFSFDGKEIPHQTGDYFFTYEYLIFGLYTPDLDRIRRNGVKIAVSKGKESKDAWYARTVDRQAEILNCKIIDFPGAHLAFAVTPDSYAAALLEALRLI
ncbi:Alpha/Beta hydrolase protein [Xylogone sp. PMI_703]|nr:Alpha/Beta hydrolase protein [Xylogone sp. PMI_703]